MKINVPYCLELDEEVKIYQKMLKMSDFDAHIAPHTLEVASMFAVMSLEERTILWAAMPSDDQAALLGVLALKDRELTQLNIHLTHQSPPRATNGNTHDTDIERLRSELQVPDLLYATAQYLLVVERGVCRECGKRGLKHRRCSMELFSMRLRLHSKLNSCNRPN